MSLIACQRIAHRGDLSREEYRQALIDAIIDWQVELKESREDRLRNLKMLKDYIDPKEYGMIEVVRRTIKELERELGVKQR